MSPDPGPQAPGGAPSRERLEAQLLELLTQIAPDVDAGAVLRNRPLREQFDFDSMDLLHFATAVSEAFAIDIAETDYAELSAIDRACTFVMGRLAATGHARP